MRWIFCPIDDPRAIREQFNCGVTDLNNYLKQFAKQNHKKGISKTWVAISEDDNTLIAGYYSLSTAELKLESISLQYSKGLPRYPIPVIRLARLAVSLEMQGKGLGELLLLDAFYRVFRCSQEIGAYGIIVDATNERAKAFYQKYDFMELQDSHLSLFIPITKVQKACIK